MGITVSPSNGANNPTITSVRTADNSTVIPLVSQPAPSSGGGGGGYTPPSNPPLNTGAIANTNASLAELPGILARAIEANNQEYQNAQSGFNAQETQQRGQYDKSTTQNQQNYDSNLMAALHAGAIGLRGLLSILRGTGAEGWANQAVRDTTNSDIQTGRDTQQSNQTSLDNSLSTFLTDLADKRHQNDVTHQNNEFAARESNATQMQDLYQKLAGYYASAGDTANANKFMAKAGSFTPQIAQYGTAPVSRYDTTPVAVQAPDITAFSGPTQQNVTATPSSGGAGNGIFSIGDARKRLAGAGAGA